jgi:hypothetical protein
MKNETGLDGFPGPAPWLELYQLHPYGCGNILWKYPRLPIAGRGRIRYHNYLSLLLLFYEGDLEPGIISQPLERFPESARQPTLIVLMYENAWRNENTLIIPMRTVRVR